MTDTAPSLLDQLGEPEGLLEHALLYASLGWTIFPLRKMVDGVCTCKDGRDCRSPGKHPATLWRPDADEGTGASKNPDEIQGWFSNRSKLEIGGLGICTGQRSGVLVIDIDTDKDGEASWRELAEQHQMPDTLEVTTGSGGAHYYYRMPDVDLRSSASELAPGVDVRANGGMAVAPPSAHKSGEVYTWELMGPEVIAELPASMVTAIEQTAQETRREQRREDGPVLRFDDEPRARAYLERALDDEIEGVANTPPGQKGGRVGQLFGAVTRIASLSVGVGYPAGVIQGRLWEAADQCGLVESIGDDLSRQMQNAWNTGASDPRPVVIQRVDGAAGDGFSPPVMTPQQQSGMDKGPPPPRPYTDYGNAERFADQHGENMRFCAQLDGWRLWGGVVWERDMTDRAMRRAKITARTLRDEKKKLEKDKVAIEAAIGDEEDQEKAKRLQKRAATNKVLTDSVTKHIKSSESRRGLDAMMKLAESEKPIPAVVEQFDTNPYIFAVENGVLDLREMEFREGRREDYITRQGPVAFDPEAKCPQFLAFMYDIMCGDDDLVTFLQRFIGYSMTGLNVEQKFLFLHGGGANGKSTLVNILRHVFGEYARMLRPEVLMVQPGANVGPTPDLARLRGARLVTSVETEEGKKLAESLVKQLTGGDSIVASHKYQKPFEFTPQFKMIFAANHEPKIGGQDYAIWRRILKVPFLYQVPEDKKNPYLDQDIIREEAAGVLRWAFDGCGQWRAIGLRPPDSVLTATAKYRDDADFLGPFLDECCIVDEVSEAVAGDLWRAWKSWADRNGEKPRSQTWLGRLLTTRGFESRKGAGGLRMRTGLRVKDKPSQVGMGVSDSEKPWN